MLECSPAEAGVQEPQALFGDLMKRGFVYMMANRKNGVIYTGVTSELIPRTYSIAKG